MTAKEIAVVVVTMARSKPLEAALKSFYDQALRPKTLVVIDNSDDEVTSKIVQESGFECIEYIPSRMNLGGAGGFALGILIALSTGAKWIWLADDDGCAHSAETLQRLHNAATEHRLDAAAPLVVDSTSTGNLAFPTRIGRSWIQKVSDIPASILMNYTSMFNGVLIRSSAFTSVGLPDYRLFIRGDEVDFGRRLARSELRFATVTNSLYRHPTGNADFHSMLGGRFLAQDPVDPIKRFYTYRNRGFLMTQPGRRLLGVADVGRYAWYFLVVRRDFTGFKEYLRLIRVGATHQFKHYGE